MLKAAIEKIESMTAPHIIKIEGDTYADKHLHRIDREQLAEPLKTHTLSSILDYIINGTDDDSPSVDINRRFIIHVADYNCVALCRELNEDKNREYLIRATDDTESFPFGRYLDVETFIIAMQTYFLQDDMTAELIRLVSSVTDSKSVTQTDNGLSQSVTAKTGILTCSEVVVPNSVVLYPVCTFVQAEQPSRRFVFRLRGGENGVTAALFAADGNAWKRQAIHNIYNYFLDNLPPERMNDVIILA